MGKFLSQDQIDGFHRDGFVSGLPILTRDEVSELNARTEAFERERPQDIAWAFDIKANLLFDWVYELGRHGKLLDAVEDLIGPDILMTNATFRIKNPGSHIDYGWHQDSARIEVKPAFVIVYVALSDATVENGCLRVIPATHDRVRPFTLTEGPGQLNRLVARVVGADPDKAVNLTLAPGEAAIFHGNAVHGSAANTSDYRRVAILYDYTPARAVQHVGRGSGQLVRGVDTWGNWGHEPVPEPGLTEANILNRRAMLTTYHENVLMGPRLPGESITFPDRPY